MIRALACVLLLASVAGCMDLHCKHNSCPIVEAFVYDAEFMGPWDEAVADDALRKQGYTLNETAPSGIAHGNRSAESVSLFHSKGARGEWISFVFVTKVTPQRFSNAEKAIAFLRAQDPVYQPRAADVAQGIGDETGWTLDGTPRLQEAFS